MSFKTPIFCDRRVYDKKGKWKSPNNDHQENVFYFVREPLTMEHSWENGREQLKPTMTICVYGGKPIVVGDMITLETQDTFRVMQITVNYLESNILLKDMLKPRIESMDLVLE